MNHQHVIRQCLGALAKPPFQGIAALGDRRLADNPDFSVQGDRRCLGRF